jgi:GNAT superfamily N-acetyltransferase
VSGDRGLDGIRVHRADTVAWADLAVVFGARGPASRCFCQRYKLAPRESFGRFPAEERAARLREQAGCDDPGWGTSGLVAHLEDEPVGWCAVEPRPAFGGLVRNARVPWVDRDEDPTDERVWAVTCLLTRAGHRRRGVSRVLARAAVDHARAQGAVALEAYPMTTTAALTEELHVGTVATFRAAGLVEVGRPTRRRAVMRVDF